MTGALLWLFHQNEASFSRSALIDAAQEEIDRDGLEDNLELRRVFGDLSFLVAEVERILSQDEPVTSLTESIQNFTNSSPIFDQIRYLDATGQEMLRVNLNAENQAVLVAASQLQDKSDRYYFLESIGLPRGAFFVSALDLNIENDRIEQPLKPMLRFCASVRGPGGKVEGVIVLNFLAKRLLQNYAHEDLMHVDSLGDWMQGGATEDRWGRQLGHGRSFSTTYPEAWAAIHREGKGLFEFEGSLFLANQVLVAGSLNNPSLNTKDLPFWYVVRYFEDFDEASGVTKHRVQLFRIFLLAIIVWLMVSLWIARLLCQRSQAFHEMKVAKLEAESANKAKSQFLAAMSHEIRTPMNGVIGMAQILEFTELNAEQKEFVEIIKSSGDTLLTVIDDILNYSKLEAGRLMIEVISLDPSEIIRKTVQLLNAHAQEKGLALECQFEASLPPAIDGDPTRFQQILYNLIGNAIKFTEKGSVQIRAASESSDAGKQWLRVDVIDSGIGMTSEQLKILFQPFTQADNSITRRFGGTGLGLTISQRLAELMGGRIDVTSEYGVGSTFTLRLPLDVTLMLRSISAGTLGENKELIHQCGVFRDRVLIVDDDSQRSKPSR
jgi:signal transduction histidine kinase